MSHWYRKDGSPCYEIIGKNGKTRDTTLRDARTMNLFPSTTGVIGTIAAPGLVRWKVEQGIKATIKLGNSSYAGAFSDIGLLLATEDSIDPAFKRDVQYEADKIAREARDKGQAIHDAVQHYIDGDMARVPDEYLEHCQGVERTLVQHFGSMSEAAWITEESFACREGYGGRSDLGSRVIPALGDFKCKDFDENKLPECYDEHPMQVASYRHGLDYPEESRLFNLFVSTKVPGLCHIVFHTKEEIERGHKMFMAALELWHLTNNYRPVW